MSSPSPRRCAMAAEIIDGKGIAQQIRRKIEGEVRSLRERGVIPGLAVVFVGENPASASYVRGKERACAEVGIETETLRFADTISEGDLIEEIRRLNQDPSFHGILVQLPLPGHIDSGSVAEAVACEKDVDGLHPVNVGKLCLGQPTFVPGTPRGICELLAHVGVDPEGKHAVIAGRSNIVGRPLAILLSRKARGANATVTVCHSRTADLPSHTRQADILVAAMGQPEKIVGSMIKPDAVVIDVGVNRVADSSKKRGYRLVGDVHFESAREVASYITPVPGGVGPMTIAMLLRNTVDAAAGRIGRSMSEAGIHGPEAESCS